MSKITAAEQQAAAEFVLVYFEQIEGELQRAGSRRAAEVSQRVVALKAIVETLKFLQRPDVEVRRKSA